MTSPNNSYEYLLCVTDTTQGPVKQLSPLVTCPGKYDCTCFRDEETKTCTEIKSLLQLDILHVGSV